MEKIAIVSDIHANLTAWNAFLENVQQRGIKRIFCLGDIVYKGCSPDLVIDSVRKNCEVVIKGNCDETMASNEALEKLYWTRIKIGEERANYLKNLPKYYEFYMSGYFIRLFHASPFGLENMYNPMYNNEISTYSNLKIENPKMLFENTSWLGKTSEDEEPDIIGYGHIHTPNIVRIGNKTIFNPGSVGMPVEMENSNNVDKSTKFSTVSSYIILEGEFGKKDLSEISFQVIRFPYNLEEEISRLENSDMQTKEMVIRKLRSAEP